MRPTALPALALAVAGRAAASRNGPDQALTFEEDGTFQISILEDLHYGEAPGTYGPTQDALTTKTINKVLDAEAGISLVVVNGDAVSRDNLLPNSTLYLDHALAPLLEHNLTWASLHGNHESNNARNPADVYAREHRWPNARTRSLVSNQERVGMTNYYLPVFAPDCPQGCGCEPEMIIWFFDSRGGFNFNELDSAGKQVNRPSWVHTDVVDWFLAERQRITEKYNKTIPSVAFVHIPVHAYYAIQTGPGIDPRRNPGANTNLEIGQSARFCSDGAFNGTCTYGGQDIPFMKAIASTEGLMGLFVAHLHGNSWCYKWTDETLPGYPAQPQQENGLHICFGHRTGYGGAYETIRGSRQLRFRRDKLAAGEFESWIRLETGEVVGAVTLNETFGQDVYPENPYRESFCDECFQWEDYKPYIPN
ncbi:putative inactive purple acid phosphatase 16 [Paramyrothecium foliicola]|nr:putative inactive purple acid phosphatase 16 [Paramyrothecium foliicola]